MWFNCARERSMGTLPDTLLEWKDFPKGLRVLVLDEDSEAAAQIKAKLEEFDYVVLTFSNEIEALAALESGTNAFHVALVEVTTGDGCGGFRFLENACDLPTIMVSNTNCLNTTMKCLALGAAEFLQKPVSEEKLKNIWQHVVHKVFSTHENVLSKSLKPVKTTVASMLQFLPGEAQVKSKSFQGGDSGQIIGEASAQRDTLHDVSVSTDPATQETITEPCNSERFAAPSTPLLEQGGRSASDEDHQDKSPRLDNSTNLKAETWDAADNLVYRAFGEVKLDAEVTSGLSSQVESLLSVKKETQDMDGISLKRKITKEPGVKFDDMDNEKLQKETPSSASGLQSRAERVDGHVVNDSSIAEEEVGSAGDSKSEEDTSEKEAVMSSYVCNEENVDSSTEDTRGKKSNVDRACKKSNGSGKKKGKVEWTMDLHRSFLQAVEQLGVDQAIPSRILELMKVDGLTRHNVASHLQKYRSHRKHVMSREDEVAGRRSWQHFDPTWTRTNQHGSWSQKGNPTSGPVLAYPHVQLQPTPLGTPVGPPLHVWGHPTTDQSSRPMWQKPSVGTPTTWQAQDGSFWKHPGVYVDAWGCPMPGMPWYPQPMVKLPSTTNVGSGRHVQLSDPARSNGYPLWEKPIDVHPPKELIDEAIKEALKNPWMPLPLGLKPPSMESVIAELQKQGIGKIPSPAL